MLNQMTNVMKKFRKCFLVVALLVPMTAPADTCNWGGDLPLGDAVEAVFNEAFQLASGGNLTHMAKAGVTNATLSKSVEAGPIGPIFIGILGTTLGKSIGMLENAIYNNNNGTAMSRLVLLGGVMIDESIGSIMRLSGIHVMIAIAAGGVATATVGAAGALVQMLMDHVLLFLVGYISVMLLFISGGAMLYFFLPLIPVIAFFSMVINWFVMIFINILGAPIFCFNLIRTDGDGMIGRGEKYIADLIRTMVTPAVLTIGMVAFLLLFDTLFALLSSIFGFVMPVIFAMYGQGAFTGLVMSALLLLGFATMVLYLAQTLATLCTAHAVRTVGHMIGETVHNIAENMPHEQMKGAVQAGGGQAAGQAKKVAGGATGSQKVG